MTRAASLGEGRSSVVEQRAALAAMGGRGGRYAHAQRRREQANAVDDWEEVDTGGPQRGSATSWGVDREPHGG